MPCYDPDPKREGIPGPFELSEAKKREQRAWDALDELRGRYVATLKDIEEVCRENLPHDLSTMSEIGSSMLSQRILDIIDKHWGPGKPQ